MKRSIFTPSVCTIVLTGLLIVCSAFPVYAQKKHKPAAKTPATAAKTTGKCGANGLTTDEVNQLVAIHNFDRAAFHLAGLKWDCSLAGTAQAWANRAAFSHSDTAFGESIFVGSDPAETVRSAMDRWLSEKVFWTNKTATCAAGKTCTHFTQIVWRTTAKIGCGINRNATGKWRVMLVCNYDPAGNGSGPAY